MKAQPKRDITLRLEFKDAATGKRVWSRFLSLEGEKMDKIKVLRDDGKLDVIGTDDIIADDPRYNGYPIR